MPQPSQAEPTEDRNAAYKRPAGQPRPEPPANEPRPVQHTPYAYPSIDLLNAQQTNESNIAVMEEQTGSMPRTRQMPPGWKRRWRASAFPRACSA